MDARFSSKSSLRMCAAALSCLAGAALAPPAHAQQACMPPTQAPVVTAFAPEGTDIPGIAFGPNADGKNVVWVGNYEGNSAGWVGGRLYELDPAPGSTFGQILREHIGPYKWINVSGFGWQKVQQWSDTGPAGMAYDPAGFLWVAHYGGKRIYRLPISDDIVDVDAEVVFSFPVPGSGSSDRPLGGLAYDTVNQKLYVGLLNGGVVRYLTNGAVDAQYPSANVDFGMDYAFGFLWCVEAGKIVFRDLDFVEVASFPFPQAQGSYFGDLAVDPASGIAYWGRRGETQLYALDFSIPIQPAFGGAPDVTPGAPYCTGGNVTFSVPVTGDPTPTLTWRRGNPNGSSTSLGVSGNPANYTLQAADVGTNTYFARANNGCGGNVNSNVVALTVGAPPVLTSGIMGLEPDGDVCPAPAWTTFSVAAAPGWDRIEWRKAGQLVHVSTTNLMYTFQAQQPSAIYTATLVNDCGAVTTPAIPVIVDVPVSITVQPQSQSACEGASITVSVTAAGSSSRTYQWFKGSAAITAGVQSTLTQSTLTLSNLTPADAGSYHVKVTDECQTVASNSAQVTVLAKPTIAGQPVSGQPCIDDPFEFIVSADGSPPLSYQWYKNGAKLNGKTFSTLSFTSVQSADAGGYTVTVTNTCGTVTSASATLTPLADPTITQQPSSQSVISGASVTFSVGATGSALEYQWHKNGAAIAGATSSSLTIPSVTVTDAGSYAVLVSNLCDSVLSDAAVLTVVVQPSGVDACDGCSEAHVLVSWPPVPGATHYQVYRGLGPNPAAALPLLAQWQTATSYLDADPAAIPGAGYHYFLAAATSASGASATPLSAPDLGWRKLACVTGLAASVDSINPTHVALSWNPVPGATHYGAFRRKVGATSTPPLLLNDEWSEEVPNGPQSYRDYSALPGVDYHYWIVPAVDVTGAHAGDLCSPVAQTGPCNAMVSQSSCTPEGGLMSSPAMLVLLDRSVHMAYATQGGTSTAGDDALAAARTDVLGFFIDGDALGETRTVSVWTFAGGCVAELTGGFVDRDAALAALDSLEGEPYQGPSPLADALCYAGDKLWGCFGFPLALSHRYLAIYSAGVKDHSIGLCGLKPDATSGTSCADYMPLDSWQAFICFNYQLAGAPKQTVFINHWDQFAPLTGVSPATFLAGIAGWTNGVYQRVTPAAPMPAPFFDDCNGNTAPDEQDISGGFSLDCNGNGVPDECEVGSDCNLNGVPDDCDIANGTSHDYNLNGIPDRCEGYVLAAPSVAIAGLPLKLTVFNNTENGTAFILAGFLPGPFPPGPTSWPGCPGMKAGILDFANYGIPLLFPISTDAEGFGSLVLPIPAKAAGVTVLFQSIDPHCQASPVAPVYFK